MCGECHKPRCVYAARKLSAVEATLLEQIKEDNVYTCGSQMFPPDHHLMSTVIVRIGITCQSPMESTYYGAANVHFPDACYYCGELEPAQLLDDEYIKQLKKMFAIVRPLCTKCRSIGKEAKTRSPNNVVQSSKRRKIN